MPAKAYHTVVAHDAMDWSFGLLAEAMSHALTGGGS